jgi:hypothetical protein
MKHPLQKEETMNTLTNPATRIYSLNQAANLTGFSLGKFRYNKEALIEAGATVSEQGYRIPHSTLETLGWLGVKAPKSVVAPPSALELAELRIAELEAEVAELREELTHKSSFFGRRKR